MTLAHCRHRGTQREELFRCRSDWLIHGGYVPASVCQVCPYVDKPSRVTAQHNGPGSELKRLLRLLGLEALLTDVGFEDVRIFDVSDPYGPVEVGVID